jgi:hypothetical protein
VDSAVVDKAPAVDPVAVGVVVGEMLAVEPTVIDEAAPKWQSRQYVA